MARGLDQTVDGGAGHGPDQASGSEGANHSQSNLQLDFDKVPRLPVKGLGPEVRVGEANDRARLEALPG